MKNREYNDLARKGIVIEIHCSKQYLAVEGKWIYDLEAEKAKAVCA